MGSIAQQTALVGLRLLASQDLAAGAVTAFDLAYRLVLAIVEVSSSGALAVALTEWSTAVASGEAGSLHTRLRDTLALVLFIVLPIPVLVHALRDLLVHMWLSLGYFGVDGVCYDHCRVGSSSLECAARASAVASTHGCFSHTAVRAFRGSSPLFEWLLHLGLLGY